MTVPCYSRIKSYYSGIVVILWSFCSHIVSYSRIVDAAAHGVDGCVNVRAKWKVCDLSWKLHGMNPSTDWTVLTTKLRVSSKYLTTRVSLHIKLRKHSWMKQKTFSVLFTYLFSVCWTLIVNLYFRLPVTSAPCKTLPFLALPRRKFCRTARTLFTKHRQSSACVSLLLRPLVAPNTTTVIVFFVTLPPVGVQSIAMSVSVCLSARISQKQDVQTSRNFLYVLPVAVTRSSADDSALCYVLPVLWITSHICP